jgi:hemoglobin/transferrin/lactoferrin receptor protein
MRNIWGTSALALVMGMAAASAAQAQEAEGRQYAEADITVTATRRAADTFEVPSVVTVIDEEEIQQNLATDIRDLVRFEPGVSVQVQPARFNAAGSGTGRTGNSSFNIRGLDGNRVLIMVDGVRVPDAYSFSAVTFGRGDYVDLELLESVEILRGPASALYGSDGLAGAVAFTTRDPDSFLGDDNVALRGRVGYASADDSWAESLVGAGRMGDWTALLAYSRRDGHETENEGEVGGTGATRTQANPQEWSSNAVLGRLVFEPSDAHRFRLTAEYSDRDLTSDILSSRTTASGVRTDAVLTDDTSERARVTLDHRYESQGGLIDSINTSVYYQTSEAFQYTFEDRVTLPSTANDRWRASTYNNDVWGAAIQLESSFVTGPAQHRVIYGADYSLTAQEAIRDGAPPTAETFPVRPFPDTDYSIAGAYIQDEISFLNGQLILYPAVRFDSYEIDPQDDALYPGTPEGQSESHVSPKFGAVAWPTDTFGAYFSYAGGFKSPAPGQVNEYFENLVGPFAYYRVIPNTELEPETSDSFEVGLRWRNLNALGANWQANVAAYAASYDDFIERIQIGGSNTSVDPIVYQHVNLTGVEIEGVEGRVEANWDNGLGFILAAAAAEGTYQSAAGAEAPLESIDPLRVVAGLSWDDPNGRFGGQAIVTYAARKANDDTALVFRPDAFTILDLTTYWNITDAATLRLGVFNVTDEAYWLWGDVRGSGLTMAPTSLRDAYTQPGRNYSASISYRF